METLGQYLKTQRELRSLELSAVADETKVAYNWLASIENDNWDSLPGKAFARGFVKSYAKAICLDVEDVISRFDDMFREEVPHVKSVRPQHRKWHFRIALIIALFIVAVVIVFLSFL